MSDSKSSPVILIADDDPDDRLLMKEAFEERCSRSQVGFVLDGAHLIRVVNGDAAPLGDTRKPYTYPDLIILDLNMPLKDGREVLREIKSSPRLRTIPTIIMTTSANEDDIRCCYEAGASSYIIKPSSYSELLDVVSSLTSYWTRTVSLPRRAECHDQ